MIDGCSLSSGACFWNIKSVLHTEFKAFCFAMEIVSQEQMKVAFVESNSLCTILKIHKGHDSNSIWFSFILDILHFGFDCNVLSFDHVIKTFK